MRTSLEDFKKQGLYSLNEKLFEEQIELREKEILEFKEIKEAYLKLKSFLPSNQAQLLIHTTVKQAVIELINNDLPKEFTLNDLRIFFKKNYPVLNEKISKSALPVTLHYLSKGEDQIVVQMEKKLGTNLLIYTLAKYAKKTDASQSQ